MNSFGAYDGGHNLVDILVGPSRNTINHLPGTNYTGSGAQPADKLYLYEAQEGRTIQSQENLLWR